MKIIEIGTGYTSIPAKIGAATEIVVEQLSTAFSYSGHSVEVFDIKDTSRRKTDLPITEVKVPFFGSMTDKKLGAIHKLKRVLYSICLACKLKKRLKNTNEKLILHFHNQYNLFFYYLVVPKRLQKRAYTAYTIHSYIWHGEWKETQKTIKRKYFQECLCVKKADGVFALNQKTCDNILCYLKVDPAKIHLIDNGVDTNTYRPETNEKREEIKHRNNLENKRVFIQVGSVCDRKNQLGSLELLLPFMNKDANIVFCYAGGIISDEYQQSISDYAKENNISDRVIYCGEIAPGNLLNEFYNLGEAMIFPSKAEGFSLVILEAMSAGIPVVVPDELDFHASDMCITFENEEDFAKCIQEKILDNEEREGISHNIRKNIEKNYSWNSISETYWRIWNQ